MSGMSGEGPIYVLKGGNGQLEVYANRVRITRKGLRAKAALGMYGGDKTIFLHQISGVTVKRGGWMTGGFIQFTIAGNLEQRRDYRSQARDENTVTFGRKHNALVEQIEAHIARAAGAAAPH